MSSLGQGAVTVAAALAVATTLALMLLTAVVHALKDLTDDAFDLRSRIVHVVSFLSFGISNFYKNLFTPRADIAPAESLRSTE